MSETDISRDIREKLEAHGYRCDRLQSGQVKVSGGWMHLARKGTPDTIVFGKRSTCGHADVFFLETKTPIGKLSEHQIAWHAWAEKLGVRVAVVRSAREALDILRKWEN